MSHPFLLLALPRSRTAWLATWLTWGPVMCWHDGLGLGWSVGDLRHRLTTAPTDYAGTADTLLGQYPEAVEEHFPEAPIVLVRRPLGAVLDSAARWAGGALEPGTAAILERHEHALVQLSKLPRARAYRFEDLSDPEVLAGIWGHVTRGAVEPPPWERTAQLVRMNIQCPRAETMRLPLVQATAALAAQGPAGRHG